MFALAGLARGMADTSNRPVTRRGFLGVAAGGVVLASGLVASPALGAAPAQTFRTRPITGPRPFGTLFTLGVASGEPSATSVVIWTRIAPDPLAPDGLGGMASGRPVRVEWELAADPGFSRVVRRGATRARPAEAWTAHVEITDLNPAREYWYRWRCEGEISPIGRTRTLPGRSRKVDQFRFANVSCNDYQHGQWGAFNGLAEEDLDLWIHVGDYLYEYGPDPSAARQHDGAPTDSIETLEQYRNRYALYRLDPALQAAHASAPMLWVPDDHEVENNHAGLVDEEDTGPTERFARQKAVAFQAAWEHMPMGYNRKPRDSRFRLYRDFRYGELAHIQLLDTRQYRADQDGGDGIVPRPFGLDPDTSLLGSKQETWVKERLVDEFGGGGATWKVLAQQIVMTQTAFVVPNGVGGFVQVFNMDAWDGYVATRQRLLDFVDRRRVNNLVVLAGDIHSTWVSDLCTDFSRPDETVVGSELVCTSISSNFPGQFVPLIEGSLPANPNVKYFNGGKAVRTGTADEHHGYISHTVTPTEWRADIRQVANIDDPVAPMSTVATFVIEEGRPGPQRA